MKISTRVYLPVGLACVLSVALIAGLWWQLARSAQLIPSSGVGTQDTGDGSPSRLVDSPVDPRDRALLYLRQGDLQALRGDWSAAEREYTASVKAGGGLPALRKLAQAQLQRRNIEGVRSTIAELRDAGARAEDLLLLQSIVDLRTGEMVQARERLEGATESPQKHYGLALLSVIEGNHQRAANELAEVVSGWEPVLRSYARTLQAAYDEFALFPEGNNLHLITLLSRALAQVHECELALPLLVQVTRAEVDYRDAWIVQGYCELTTERLDQAVASLEHAYGIDPQKPEIQYFLARAYGERGEHGNAITFFEYALENGFEPQTEIRIAVAEEALALGNADLALEQYSLLTKAQDTEIASYIGFVSTAIALGRSEEAFVQATAAVLSFPDDARAYELLGWAAAETNRIDEARTTLEKAIKMDPFLESAKQRLEKLEEVKEE